MVPDPSALRQPSLWRWAAALFVLLFCAPPARAQVDLDQVTLLSPSGPGGLSVALTQVHLDAPFQPGQPSKGTGTLRITQGDALLAEKGPVHFSGLVADEQRRLAGPGLTWADPVSLPDFLGSGVGFTLAAGAAVTLTPDGANPANATLAVAATIQAVLPYRSSSGDPAGFTGKGELRFTAGGSAGLDVAGTLSEPVASRGLRLAGMDLRAQGVSLKLARLPGAALQLTVTLDHPALAVPLPGILCQDGQPLSLAAASATIDAEGSPSFQNAHLAAIGSRDVGETGTRAGQVAQAALPLAQLVQARPGLANLAQAQRICLAAPMNFELIVRSATATMDAGVFKTFTLDDAALALPADLVTDGGTQGPVVVPFKGFNLLDGVLAVAAPISLVPGAEKGALLKADAFMLDLSAQKAIPVQPAEPTVKEFITQPGWVGLYLQSAQILLPADLVRQPNGQPVTVAVKDAIVDANGVTCRALSQTDTLVDIAEGFTAQVDQVNVAFLHNEPTEGKLSGKVPVGDSKLGLSITVASAGTTVDVQTGTEVSYGKYGLKMALSSATIGPDPNAPESGPHLMLGGTLTFQGVPKLNDTSVVVNNLAVDAQGRFPLKEVWLDLPHPSETGLGPLSVSITQLGLCDQEDGWVGLTGSAKLSDSLPVVTQTDFRGLKIHANKSKLEIGSINFNSEVFDVAAATATLSHFDKNGDSPERMEGAGRLKLMGGDAAGLDADIRFMVGDDFWYIASDLKQLPKQARIPLGNTGLFLSGFSGGLGHNVKIEPQPPVPKQTPRYTIAPAPGAGNLLFQSGATIEWGDRAVLWGTTDFTVQIPEFALNLNGMVYILNPEGNDDRAGWADLFYDHEAGVFRGTIGADICLLSRDLRLAEATGSVELFIGPERQYLYVGWPVDRSPISLWTPITTVSGGVGLDLKPDFALQAYGSYSERIGPFSGYLGVGLGILNEPKLHVNGSVTIRGEADFWIAWASVAANLAADFIPDGPHLHAQGTLSASIGCFLGHVTKHVGFSENVF